MSLQNRLKNAQTSIFVGREEQLDIFRKNINPEIPAYPFILISGQGGVGKSTLLRQLQDICNENRVPHALTDYTENTPSAAMNQLATSLEKEEHVLRSFRERYQKYLQLKEIIQKEPDKPDALGQIFSRVAGKSVVVAGRATPITSVAIDLVGAEIVEEQVAAFSNWLFEKLKHKDDVQLMLDPTAELTPLFVTDLNKISNQKQAVLIFDTFEDTHTTLLPWLMKLFGGQYGDVSEHICFVFAGRSFNQHDWLSVAPLLLNCNLEPFTKQEVTHYLKNYGVVNPGEVDDIYHLSGGLPVHVAMLATSGKASDSKATRTVVERFLRNINDPIFRQAALHVGLSRQFDRDILSHLFASKVDSQQIETLFSWLIELPFVQNRHGYWTYHPVVRTQIIAYQRSQSTSQFAEIQKQLAEHYYSRAERNGRFAGNKWQEHSWWSYYVEATYHALCANPRENLEKTKQEIAEVILEVDSTTIISWVSALRQAATDIGEHEATLQLAALVEAGISAIENNKLGEAFKLFDTFDLLSSEPHNMNFEEGTNIQQIPTGWIVNGNKHQFGIDANTAYAGNYSGYLKSSDAGINETGRMIQFMKAEKYLGKRIRFSGSIKSREVEEWGGLWMGVEGRTGVSLGYDDMRDRPITGTKDWRKCEIVLDVPKESRRITFGARLQGKGQLWLDNLEIEVVDTSIPITDIDNKQEPLNLDFGQITTGIENFPVVWNRSGSHSKDYAIGVDKSEIYQGKVSAYLKSRETYVEGTGVLHQNFHATHYIDKRLRMSAFVKSQGVEEWAGLWMRVDGEDRISFDNMYNRPITGTTDWKRYEVVLDVPNGATSIAFGIILEGKGQVWVNDFQFEVVGQDIPTTDNNKTEPINLNFELGIAGKNPTGWFLSGNRPSDYVTGIDDQVIYDGIASGFLKSKVDKIDGFGTLMQEFGPENYRNQRLRMSAYVKANNVIDSAWIWMRVDGPRKSSSLSFDNMNDRPIKGTTDWQKYEIVLDVPKESTNIAFGVALSGTGRVWVDDFKFEIVSPDVPATKTNDLDETISTYTKAIQINPSDVTAFLSRAGAYTADKKYELAIADCDEAIHLNAESDEAYGRRGLVYMIQGKHDQAVRDFKESIRLYPKNAGIFYQLACAYALQKNLKDTLTALRSCFEIDEYRYWVKNIPEDPDFDFVRSDPRFHALLIEFAKSE